MGTTLEDLLNRHPRAAKGINLGEYGPQRHLAAIARIRDYAYLNNIGDHAMDSVADLLAAIESHLKASEPLSDEEIELMKWGGVNTIGDSWRSIAEAQHADIDRLHAEIRRLRKGVGDAR